jgi:hypothetical protein
MKKGYGWEAGSNRSGCLTHSSQVAETPSEGIQVSDFVTLCEVDSERESCTGAIPKRVMYETHSPRHVRQSAFGQFEPV